MQDRVTISLRVNELKDVESLSCFRLTIIPEVNRFTLFDKCVFPSRCFPCVVFFPPLGKLDVRYGLWSARLDPACSNAQYGMQLESKQSPTITGPSAGLLVKID